jgi:hypothetical protein
VKYASSGLAVALDHQQESAFQVDALVEDGAHGERLR